MAAAIPWVVGGLTGAAVGSALSAKKPAAPPAPDYAGAAQAQGQANLEAARLQARLSNPNISGPLGGQRVTFGRSVFDQTAYDKAMADYQKQLEAFNQGQAEGGEAGEMVFDPISKQFRQRGGFLGDRMPVAPTKEQFTKTVDEDTPFLEQYLNPEAEAAIKAQQRVQEQYARLGEKAFAQIAPQFETPFRPELPEMAQRLTGYGEIGAAPTLRADYQMGFTPEGLPIAPQLEGYGRAAGGPTAGMYGLAGAGPAAPGQIAGADVRGVGGVSYGPREGQYGYAQGFVPAQQLQERLDLRNVAAMPVAAGTTAQEAILSRLTPQVQQRRAALENQLANQGIPRGSEAYREAMTELAQQENDLIQQAALQGINVDLAARGQGFQEAQAQAQLLNQARQAQFGMGTTQLGLYNQALQQNLAQGLSVQEAQNRAQAQDLQQRLAMGQFGREGQQLAFQMGQSAQQAQNQAIAQNFAQAQAAQQAQNQAIAQNQAAAMQQYQAEMARQAQGFGQRMDLTGLYNQAINAQNAAALQQYQAQLGAQGQQFNQAQAEAAFRNAARTQALQEQAALRAQPLNEIAALMGGSQVQMPQFQGYSGAAVAPAPIFGAAQAQAQFAQNNYANQIAAYNAQMQGLYGLGAAGIQGYFSRPAPSPTPSPTPGGP